MNGTRQNTGPGARSALRVLPLATLAGCCWITGFRPPEGVARWPRPATPTLSLPAKAEQFQSLIESRFLSPEGVLVYRRKRQDPDASYGALADGAFHTGIYLASQALRYRVTGLPEARAQVLKTLDGMRLLMEVSGRRGLLARHVSPAGTVTGERWRASTTHPEFDWRSDVSKDQYAGFFHGLGVALAVIEDDEEIRDRIARLAVSAADHLIENGLRIVDVDDDVTTYGDLNGRIFCFPIGVNAAISLAIAKVAAESSGDERYREFHADLIRRGYAGLTGWTYLSLWNSGRRVNENMLYLALYPLLLLEDEPEVRGELRAAEQSVWRHVKDEHNAFFSFVHLAVEKLDPVPPASDPVRGEAAMGGVEALLEFPEDKVERPVDVTGDPFPRAFRHAKHCVPMSTRAIPLYLRPRSSCFWASNPYRLAGDLYSQGETHTAGSDYLLAYWMGRFHGAVDPE